MYYKFLFVFDLLCDFVEIIKMFKIYVWKHKLKTFIKLINIKFHWMNIVIAIFFRFEQFDFEHFTNLFDKIIYNIVIVQFM